MNQEIEKVWDKFADLGIYTKEQVNEMKRTEEEAHCVVNEEDRDMYVAGGGVSIDTAQQLCDIFHNPKYTVNDGTFAYMTYISEVKLNKKYNYGGWRGPNGDSYDRDAIEQSGRQLGKKYLNKFYDSDEYKTEKYKGGRGSLPTPWAVFKVTSQSFNWGAMKYGETVNKQKDTIQNATTEDLADYISQDPTMQKRVAAYIAQNPDKKEEVEAMIQRGTLDNETAVEIYRTPLRKVSNDWEKINDYFSLNNSTKNYGVRLTGTRDLTDRTLKVNYFMLSDEKMYRISKDEYYQIKKMFSSSMYHEDGVHTTLGDLLSSITSGVTFKNYCINQIVSLSFQMINTVTNQTKGFKFINNAIEIPKTNITLSAYELLGSEDSL